jgi:hypothetical protein
MRSGVVVDTNVLVVANLKNHQAGPNCVLACVDALETVKEKRVVCIDSGARCFNEYFRHANRSGEPGLGDAFVKWLWERQAHPRHCEKVDITPKIEDAGDFEEFPDDPSLNHFDRTDRKFVAVALRSRHQPTILNATDTDWWHFNAVLEKHKISVRFLCPELMHGPS